jgi:hypothetical protein
MNNTAARPQPPDTDMPSLSKRHRRSPSAASLASAASAASYHSAATFSHEADAFLKLRPHGESSYQTLEYICNHPREGWIFNFLSMTERQLYDVRGRNGGCADANKLTITDLSRYETQLENEIANMSNTVAELNERHMDLQNQLLEATANQYSLKRSREEASEAIDKARSENKMLELQVELTGKILFISDQPKPFGGAFVTLQEVRKIMLLDSFSDIDELNANQTHLCIRILSNLGLLKNPYFRKLWEKNTPEEKRAWESVHRRTVSIQTGKVNEDVMKLRLANYLDIAMPPVNESGDESNDDDDPNIPTTVGGFALDSIPEDELENELLRRRQSK